MSHRRVLLIMVAVLLGAAALRLVAWRDAPPGLRFDEMLVTLQAEAIQDGARPVYIDDIYEEPLYHYLTALAFSLFGPHLLTLRLVSAALGLLTVAILFALTRRMSNERVALLAAALYAISFWALMYSRLGLRLIALPLLLMLGLYFTWRGLERQRRADFVWAGLWLGLTTYTYAAMRLLPVWWAGLLLCLVWRDRTRTRSNAVNLLITTALALLIALPLVVHFMQNPAADRRLNEVTGPIDALHTGDAFPLLNSTWLTAAMFLIQGDPETLYNIPGRPVFDGLTGLLFVGGVLVALTRWRMATYRVWLVWLGVGLIPSVLTWPAGSNNHTLLAQPVIFMLTALGVERVSSRISKIAPLVIAALLVFNAARSIFDYFGTWATLPSVRQEHQADIAAFARNLGREPIQMPLVFSSGQATHWNPWSVTTFRMTAPLGYTNARWFDARSSFIFPQGHTDLTLLAPAHDDVPAPLDARLIEDLFPIVEPSPLATEHFSATHLISSLNTRLITLTQASVSWPAGSAAQLPIAFANRLELIGYDLRRTTVETGKNIRLTTYWRAQDLGQEPLSIFVHVLDEHGSLAAQWDGFTIAPEYVQRGDVIVQVHFIPIPPNFAEGTYQLALGLYYPKIDQQPRVPIVSNGQVIADRVLLQSVEMINDQ